MMLQDKKQEIRKFMMMLAVVNLAVFAVCYRGIVRSYNTTMLALSYRYGFTSRSLIGTIYHLVDAVLPIDMINYDAAVGFALAVTGLFFVVMMIFFYQCLKSCSEEDLKNSEYLILILSVSLVSTFSFPYNFFRVDICMIMMSLLAVICIIKDKAVWLCVPLSVLGVMFHQGYVFMYFNLILVLLLYRALSLWNRDKKRAVYYGGVFLASFLLASALFLWFEFFSRSDGALYFDSIQKEAEKLSYQGIYHSTLLYHEVLGIDLASTEAEYFAVNHNQIIVFTVVCLPMIFVAVRFFVNIYRRAEGFWEKAKYLMVAVGAVTILPNFILKIDYGRWIMAVVVYYMGIVLALLAMGDPIVKGEVQRQAGSLQKKPGLVFYLMAVILLIPYLDVNISPFVRHLASMVNRNILHWY